MATGPRYVIEFSKRAAKQIRGLPSEERGRIAPAIDALADDPRPHGSEKLKGSDDYRIRVGDYRVIYSIEDDRLIVNVLRVGHRKDVYRRKK